jgi:CRP/FNR family transcriptional regulator, cyclic AMP receptor protein
MTPTLAQLIDVSPLAAAQPRTKDALHAALDSTPVSLRRHPAGRLLLLEGDPCDEVHLVAEGLLRVRHLSPEGREHVVSYLGPGRLLNLVPALDDGAALGSVDALTDATTYAIPCDLLREWIARDADLAAAVARYLAGELRRVDAMLADMALHTVRARLARFLLTHAESNPAHHRWTQAMIAANIGTVRDVVGRLLREMRQEGIIRRERGRLVIVDREALEREAEGE